MLELQGLKVSQEIRNQNRNKSATLVLFLGISVFALGQGLEFGNGLNNQPGFVGLTVSLYFLLACVIIPEKSPFPNIPEKLVFTILVLEVALQIFELLIVIPSYPMSSELIANLWQFRLLMIFRLM